MKIFVTCGTQLFPFERLLRAMEPVAAKPGYEVFAQRGRGDYIPSYASSEVLDHDAFEQRIAWADVVVTHGGGGSIIAAMRAGKPVVAMPRKASLGEHVDDHQEQIVGAYERMGHIIVCRDEGMLGAAIDEAAGAALRPFVSNNQVFCAGFPKLGRKVCFIASSGGHFEQLLMLDPIIRQHASVIVTEDVGISRDYPAGAKVYKLLQVNRREATMPIKMAVNAMRSVKILVRERPDSIVSTGALATIPLCLLGKLAGAQLVYIESLAKVDDPTRTGRLMYHLADSFVIQWESLRKCYPTAMCLGPVY